MSTTAFIVLGLCAVSGLIGLPLHYSRPREERWREEQIRRGRDPRDVDDEARVRKALVETRNDCSQAVMDGRDWQRELEMCLTSRSAILERHRPKLGRKFIALVEQMDPDDLLDKEAYAKAFPTPTLDYTKLFTKEELKEFAAYDRRISDAAFPDA